MKPTILLLFCCLFFGWGCSSESESEIINPTDDETVSDVLYFPPIGNSDWETLSLDELQWNISAEQELYVFLEERDTDAFLLLKDGRIVLERYFGDFTQNDGHVWNSAGKNLMAMTIGIAQEEGFLSLNDTSADYLGNSWSSMTLEQEQNVTVRHHLTMSTGLEYEVDDVYCTDSNCLTYRNAPGDFWFYHNAPYTLLGQVITSATGDDFREYFSNKIRNRIGMQGVWLSIGFNNNYFSTARSMARFGLLNLNKGIWDGEPILDDPTYFEQMTNTSQNGNKSYGYLYWLNGKESYRVPGTEIEIMGELIPNAPDDLFAGLGANDQKLYIVPSEGMVIVRMGDDAGETLLGPSSFDNELWEKINAVIN